MSTRAAPPTPAPAPPQAPPAPAPSAAAAGPADEAELVGEDDADDVEDEAPGPPLDPPSLEPVRVDKWLWAARMVKTRTQATDACAGGLIKVNGVTAKASQKVKPGDRVEGALPSGRRVLEVRGTAERRGSAPVARSLYTDLAPPERAPRLGFLEVERGEGRPTKVDRRKMDKFKTERVRGW
jgi:ribosome-associated heat shock protein Hsp15